VTTKEKIVNVYLIRFSVVECTTVIVTTKETYMCLNVLQDYRTDKLG